MTALAERERLRESSAIVVGLGALGSPAALYLAAAGVGRIGVVDDATVDTSHLDRQVLHFAPDVGVGKAQNAAVKLRALNPEVQVEPYPARLDELNAEAIVAGADVVLDCTNDPATGLAVDDACCALGIPFVTASVHGLDSSVVTVVPGETGCLRCAPREGAGGAPPAFGAVAGVAGSSQALEALRLLTGVGEPEHTRPRRDGCPSCAAIGAPQSV